MKGKLAFGIFYVLIAVALATASPVLSVDEAQVYAIGETAKINIILNEAPNGLSGCLLYTSDAADE